MRWLSQLLVGLIICLIVIALPAVPAQAQCGGPFIELSPGSGVPGTEVAVNGQGFEAGKYVDIYYDRAIIATGRTNISGDFTILFTVPEGCKGNYRVRVVVLHSTLDTYFTVTPGLTVTPEKGSVDTNVTVKGQGFAKNEEGIELRYYLNDSYETVERNIIADAQGSWETSFQIPPSTRGEHKLDAEGALSRLYEIKDATFKVTPEISIDKSSGSIGDTITMTGSSFAANEKGIQILFAGQAVVTGIKANDQGDWEKSFEVPDMPTGEYSVTAEGEQTKKEDISELSFEITHDIMLSPDQGHVGMDLTVTGHGFAVNEDVDIIYDDSQVTTARTNAKGSFETSFLVPKSQYGERQVIARDTAGNNATAIFTIESNRPPVPALISPSNESRAGLVGKMTPTFKWSEVSDDSGVYYSLQIATSANVTATGEFVAPIVSVAGLFETSYTLAETEALPYGTYYWIVQAVDGANSESGWTEAYSLRVGLMPLWGFIASIAALVVLLVALIRALVVRRSIYYDRW